MSIMICGHKVRWRKPIKIYTLLKTLSFLMVVNLLAITPVFASDRQAEPARDQRVAAAPSSVSPAMALALALGVRNVPGPMVKSEGAVKRSHLRSSSSPFKMQASILLRNDDCALAPSPHALLSTVLTQR